KSESIRSRSPAETLARVNRDLYRDIKRGMFVTMSFAILDIPKARLTCVSAGHNPMLLWREESKSIHLINPNGLALGIDRGPVFERTMKEEQVALSAGDRVTFYTDGVVEAMNEQREEFGQNRFYLKARELSHLSSADFLESLMRDVNRHCGSAPQQADFT